MPTVAVRVGVAREPLDVAEPADADRLRAAIPPDQPQRLAALEAELALAASVPRLLIRGDPVATVSEALARVPTDAVTVVLTTWTLSRLTAPGRLDFVRQLEQAGRPLAWISVEGVGVAPTVPTLGDRPASGHSLIGVALFDEVTRGAETVGRCWSRGRSLAWLAAG